MTKQCFRAIAHIHMFKYMYDVNRVIISILIYIQLGNKQSYIL